MYQYTWFDKNLFTNKIVPERKPEGMILPSDIESMRVIYWGEHCTECAVPLCYNNCEKWIERHDKKCRKFYYGVYDNPNFPEFLSAAQIKFHDWGKLWGEVYKFVVSPKKEQKLDKGNKRRQFFARGISKCIKKVSPTYKLNGALEYYTKKSLRKKACISETNQFLLQVYSNDEYEFNLLLDINSALGQRYRKSMPIKKGFNQYLLDVDSLFDFEESKLNAAIYPENDYNAEIVLLCAAFVSLNKEKSNSSSSAPASKVKCVAWDLDNTIWDGILIESNPDELSLRDGVLDTIKELDRRGIIQVVVSKNDEENVIPVLKRLGIYKYFVTFSVNWNPKSGNIKSLAKMININVNTFAFIDDSHFERNEVEKSLPQVRVFTENDVPQLLNNDEFDVPITKDGEKRRKMYQTEFKRKKLEENFGNDLESFLKSCEIVAEIKSPHTEEEILRSYELLQRTNQLNLSGKKYEKEVFLKNLESQDHEKYIVLVKDKYGTYGQVAYFTVCVGETIVVNEFAMSCRVAGKFIESALLLFLKTKYDEKTIEFKGQNSKKNSLLINSLQKIGMENQSPNDDELLLVLPKDVLPKNSDIVILKEI